MLFYNNYNHNKSPLNLVKFRASSDEISKGDKGNRKITMKSMI